MRDLHMALLLTWYDSGRNSVQIFGMYCMFQCSEISSAVLEQFPFMRSCGSALFDTVKIFV